MHSTGVTNFIPRFEALTPLIIFGRQFISWSVFDFMCHINRITFIEYYFIQIFSAEFIIHLSDKHREFENFKKALAANGANFSVSMQFCYL